MDAELFIPRIEDYLSGKMTDAERIAFESELQSDPELHKAFLQHQYFLDGIKGMKIQSLTHALATIPGPAKTTRRKLIRYLSIAASLLLVLSTWYVLFWPTNITRLAKTYYATPFAELQRSDGTAADSNFQSGMEAFNKKEWNKAITAFQKIESSQPRYDQAQYFLAHAYVGKKKYKTAQKLFSQIASQKNAFVQQAEWNEVLTTLLMGISDSSVEQKLQKIGNDPAHFYHEKARFLLDQYLRN